MRTMIITIMSMTLVLAGCGGQSSTTETSTVTASASSSYEPEPSLAVPADRILQIAWDSQSQEDQYSMCFGWGYDQELMIDTFFAELDASLDITRADVIDFFEEKC